MRDGLQIRRPAEFMIRTTAPFGQHILKGVPASPGIAIGHAFVLSIDSPSVSQDHVAPDRINDEVGRFRVAMEAMAAELVNAIDLARVESTNVSTIIESYLLIVSDPIITGSIVKRIETGLLAESAVVQEFDVHRNILHSARDTILRERAQDFEHVKERLIATLRNRTLVHAAARNSVVVAGSITPQDMLFFKQTQTLGYVTEIGGINSHSCILARDLGIPAVIGIRNATGEISSNTTIIIDGYAGIVIVDPDERHLREYRNKLDREADYRQRLGALIKQPTVTTDGVTVTLHANIDTPEQVGAALVSGGDGVGLVRTEYLLMQRGHYPTMEEQTVWYRDIAERAFPLPVTFRAFDVGSDKFRDGIPNHEDNPALGLRGIRFLLYRPDLFEQQVMAVLRASANRNIRFMLPMVSVLEEVEQAREIVESCKRRLTDAGIDFDPAMPLGVMIETPAAAMMADSFAQVADFLSIGTNDLAQYALATDRTNELVADIFDAMHPAVLRMVAMIVEAARRNNKSVSVCGEMAGHAAATEMLVGLGLNELSVAPGLILELKHRIRSVSYADCADLVQRVLGCTTTPQVYAALAAVQQLRQEDGRPA